MIFIKHSRCSVRCLQSGWLKREYLLALCKSENYSNYSSSRVFTWPHTVSHMPRLVLCDRFKENLLLHIIPSSPILCPPHSGHSVSLNSNLCLLSSARRPCCAGIPMPLPLTHMHILGTLQKSLQEKRQGNHRVHHAYSPFSTSQYCATFCPMSENTLSHILSAFLFMVERKWYSYSNLARNRS